MKHEPDTHQVDERSSCNVRFVIFGILDKERYDDRRNSCSERKHLCYVTGSGDREILNDKKIGVEVWLNREEECHLKVLIRELANRPK